MKEQLPKIYNIKEKFGLAKALTLTKDLLDYYGYKDGYMFRHTEYFFMNNLKVTSKQSKSVITIEFDLEYKTKQHKVINHIKWDLPHTEIKQFENLFNNLELDIMKHTSDPDRTDQIFNKRFLVSEFEKRKLVEKGWKIIK